MSKLLAVVDSLDAVEEAIRPLYKQDDKDGKFYLQVEGYDPGEAARLRAEAAERRKQVAELKGKIPEDFNPEEWKALKEEKKHIAEERERQEREKQRREGDFEAREKKLVEKHEQERKADQDRISKLIKQRDKAILEDAARAAIVGAKGKPNLLMPHIMKRLKVEEDHDGNATLVVLDEYGQKAVADSRGSPVTLDKMLSELKASDEFGVAFEGSNASGGGANPNGSGGDPRRGSHMQGGIDLSKAKPEEKLRAIHAGRIPAVAQKH